MPYKVTCMVKTENVKPEEDISGVGAQISIITNGKRTRKSVYAKTKEEAIEKIRNTKNKNKRPTIFANTRN